jgi:hypothetical protein
MKVQSLHCLTISELLPIYTAKSVWSPGLWWVSHCLEGWWHQGWATPALSSHGFSQSVHYATAALITSCLGRKWGLSKTLLRLQWWAGSMHSTQNPCKGLWHTSFPLRWTPSRSDYVEKWCACLCLKYVHSVTCSVTVAVSPLLLEHAPSNTKKGHHFMSYTWGFMHCECFLNLLIPP